MSPEPDTLRSDVISSVSWRLTAAAIAQLINFLAVVVLARLVAPSDFGLLGMATVFTGLIMYFYELGLGSALIQRKALDDSHLSTAFWVMLVVGFAAWVVASLFAPLYATFMHQPALVGVVVVSGAGFLITALTLVQRNLFMRLMRFDLLARADLIALASYALAATALAWAGLGVWSLVVGGLVQMTVATVVLWVLSSWRPSLRFDRHALRDLMSFGGPAWTSQLLGYTRANIDYLVVGRFLGPASLGYYTMAFNVASIPRSKMVTQVTDVTFPAFSRVQDDAGRVGRAHVKVTRYISLVAFPLLMGLAVLATEFVMVVYGPKWAGVIVPLRILAIAGLPTVVMEAARPVFLARGRQSLYMKLSVVSTVALGVLVVVGARFGVEGVAAGLLLHAVVFFGATEYFLSHVLEIGSISLVRGLAPASLAGTGMVLAVLGWQQAMSMRGLATVGILAGGVGVGAVVYVALLLILRVPELGEALAMAKDARRRLGPALRASFRKSSTSTGVRGQGASVAGGGMTDGTQTSVSTTCPRR